jgi:molybdopterin-containing oxidoreductase family iron-sulfur binding subunit
MKAQERVKVGESAESEIRNPKPEIRKNSEIRSPSHSPLANSQPARERAASGSDFGLRSSFGFRASDFGFSVTCPSSPHQYWRSLEELTRRPEFLDSLHREFPPRASEWLDEVSRRQFLKLMAAPLALAGLNACTRQPTERIVPYVKQPEEIVPGQPLFFATAMPFGGFGTGLIVTSHDGHPTKIEGNPAHPASLGATNIFGQAAILDLYDPDRAQAVTHSGDISSWEAFLSTLNIALQAQQAKGGAGLRILTETVTSPTLAAQIGLVLEKFPAARWHQFEPVNRDAVREGARLAFGEVVETRYHFDQADVILALESDFLFTHPGSLRFAREFADRRRVGTGARTMNRLYVVESTPTLTGATADHRLPLRSGDVGSFAHALAQLLRETRQSSPQPPDGVPAAWLAALANDLLRHKGASLVVAGEHQPARIHALAHWMNDVLGNVGKTVEYTVPVEANPVNQVESLRELVEALKSGQVEMLAILGGNPVFTAPADFDFARHFTTARLRLHLSLDANETSALCHWHVPEAHFLETWGDVRAFDGTVSIIQPLIEPLYGGKSPLELLDAMLQRSSRNPYEIVREHWRGKTCGLTSRSPGGGRGTTA